MTRHERKAMCDGVVAQLGMLVASIACDPRCDSHLVATSRAILDAARELNRALGKEAIETPRPPSR